MRCFYFILFFLLLQVLQLKAQTLEWDVNLHTFADNREYGKSSPDRAITIFGARFAPELGVQIDTIHHFKVGFNALHEFGSKKFIGQTSPVLYYQLGVKNIDFIMGIFPRHQLLSDYPRAILNDTLQYYRPNVEGMLFKYENKKVRETIWIDWTSRQTATERETFLFGISGKYKPGIVFISHYAMMFHNAGPAIEIPGDHVQDNGAAAVQLGLDLSHKTILDSLTISAGGLISFERTRGTTGWHLPKGGLFELHAGYRRIGVTNTFYTGKGHNLIYGDQFYTRKAYNRTDLGWTPIRYKGIEGKFVLSFHFLEGVIDSQQSFNLRFNVGGRKSPKR
jgi:hypothetical protein